MGSIGKSSLGRHDTREMATGIEASGAAKPYEFGDTMNIDASGTILNAVMRDMEDMLRRTLGDDVRLTLELAAERLVVRADQGQLQQVLLNLAVNARDAMPDGGTLRIATSGARDSSGQPVALIEVSDTGMGMTDDVRQHLFEPFRRMHTMSEFPGVGIGLATAARIVQRYGGRIWANSVLGEGTSFHFTLPQAAATRSDERVNAD